MHNLKLLPMHPQGVVCPYAECGASERIGVHSRQERRYKCHTCGRTFSETVGTPLYGLKHPLWVVVLVLALLSKGCPVPAIVFAFGLDERTVRAWLTKAGQHAQAVQEQLLCQGQLALRQVQADELYVRVQRGRVWVATGMDVFTRLFLWGSVSSTRDTALVRQVVERVRQMIDPRLPLLWATDGFAAWATTIRQLFQEPICVGQTGRLRRLVWPTFHIVQVIKSYHRRCLSDVQRTLAYGSQRVAEELVYLSQGDWGDFNTAYIERLNATWRGWLPAFARRSRTPACQIKTLEAALFWSGVVYNFCTPHASLHGSPAMAADLTDHLWSVDQLLRFRPRRI